MFADPDMEVIVLADDAYIEAAAAASGVHDGCRRLLEAPGWAAADAAADTSPGGRFGHTAVSLASGMLVFGGRTSHDYCADTWAYTSEESGGGGWTQLDCAGPSPRAGHAAVASGGTTMVVFGGGISDTACSGDVWELDASVPRWRLLGPTGRSPSARKGHTATMIDARHVVVFGGTDVKKSGHGRMRFVADADTWLFDVRARRWGRLQTAGEGPCPRMYHVAETCGPRSLLVFGGRRVADGHDAFLNDLYELVIDPDALAGEQQGTHFWRRIVTTGDVPSPRMCASSVYSHGAFGVFLGGAAELLPDMFVLDTAARTWRRLDLPSPPEPRTRPTTVVHGNQLTLFGGCGREQSFRGAIYRLPLVCPSLQALAAEWLRRCDADALAHMPAFRSIPTGTAHRHGIHRSAH